MCTHNFRDILQEIDLKNAPNWVKLTLRPDIIPDKISCGTFKEVYVFGKVAVSVERSNGRDMSIFERFKKMKYKQHLVYPKEVFIGGGYTFYLMNSCPNGDLFDMLTSDNYQIKNKDIFQLKTCLVELHENRIYLCDIKPENIMWCGSRLAFIDLDSAITSEKIGNDIQFTPSYSIFQFSKFTSKSEKHLWWNDLFAFALVTLWHIGKKYKIRLLIKDHCKAVTNGEYNRLFKYKHHVKGIRYSTRGLKLQKYASKVIRAVMDYVNSDTLPDSKPFEDFFSVSFIGLKF